MRLRGDDRAVTVQVGAVLLLGILVISLSIFQATVVPNENEQVEFQHNQVVQQDMQSFRSAVTRAGGAGLTQSVAVRLGTQYPERALFINPPPPTGTLQTSASSDIEIRNARALDDETDDYWTGADDRAFETTSVRYSPSYNVYQNAPTTVYEGSVLYNRFDGGTTVAQSQQSVVDGRTISLVAVDGELSRSQLGAVAVDVRPKSVSQRTVTIEGNETAGEQVTILIPTQLSNSTWEDLLADEIDSGGDAEADKYIESVTSGPAGTETVKIVFEPGHQYNLNLAKVGVGTGVDEPEAAYVTTVSGDDQVVPEGTTRQFVVEVRDQYNNPISGVELNPPFINKSAQAGNDSVAFVGTGETDSDGQVVVEYTAPDDVDGEQTAEVKAGFGSPEEQNATISLRVEDSDNSGSSGDGGSNINPSDSNSVTLEGATIADKNSNQVSVTLNNPGTSNRVMDEMRFNFYDEDTQNGKTNPPNELRFDGKVFRVRGDYVAVNKELAPGDTNLSFEFYKENEKNGKVEEYDVNEGDFFVITVRYDNGEASTYFVAPSGS